MLKSVTVKNYLSESLTLILDRPEESGLIIESITGIGAENATVNITEVSSKDGGIFNSARRDKRNIVMNLKFLETKDAPTIEDVRHKTYKFFPLKRKITLTFLTDNWELMIDGYVESNEPDIFSKDEGCQISILCPEPNFRSSKGQRTWSSGSEPLFEFPFHNDMVPYDRNLTYDPDNPYDPNKPNIYQPEDGLLNVKSGILVQFGNINDPPQYISSYETKFDMSDLIPENALAYRTINFSFIAYIENDKDPSFIPELKIEIDSEEKVVFSGYPSEFHRRFDCILNMEDNDFGDIMYILLSVVEPNKLQNCKVTIEDIKIYGLEKKNNRSISLLSIINRTSDEEKIITDNYLIDPERPFYAFIKDYNQYNLQKTEGIVFGEISRYCLPHKIYYEGSLETGFVMTIEFTRNFVEDLYGLTENKSGYIVIRNPRYPKKTITINLDRIKELLPRCSKQNLLYPLSLGSEIKPLGTVDVYPETYSYNVPIGQKGDLLIINTQRGKRGIYYAKPNYRYNSETEGKPPFVMIWGYTDPDTYEVHYYMNDELNVLGAVNKDAEWFQIGPGYNELRVYHTFHPERITVSEDEIDKIHADCLDIEVLNDVYYEGV